MRLGFRLGAAAVAFVATVFWLFGGPNTGWTKTSVARSVVEPVTGFPQVVWERTFLPGVDFLAAAYLVAGVLTLVSLAFRPARSDAPA